MLDYIFHNSITTATENNRDRMFRIGRFPLYMMFDMKNVHVVPEKYTHKKTFFFGNHINTTKKNLCKPIQSAVVSELNEDDPMLNDFARMLYEDRAR